MEPTPQWHTEQTHFDQCKTLIEHNITRYEEEYEKRHKQTQELLKAMKTGDPELYNQAMTSASLETHASNKLRKNRTALQQPYFGRIDYLEKLTERESAVYIGKNGIFRNRTEVVIADWRAPISSVYYENEMGEGCYSLPDGNQVEIALHLKRTYDVEDGILKGYYDSDVASNDKLLVQYLSRNKEAVLGDIIATIQKEQNEIIRESPFANILVQGVAGSGKTTVAMHRISYILYNYKERFTSNEFCIIGGNDILLSYITGGLPELDVPDVKQKRMDSMLTHLLGKEWKKKQEITQMLPDAPVRSKISFVLELELFLMHLKEEYLLGPEVKDRQLGLILSRENSERFVAENPQYSLYRLLQMLDERVKTRIKFLSPEGEVEFIKAKMKQYKDHFKARQPKEDIYCIYGRFLEDYAARHPGSIDLAAHMQNAAKGNYDIYDAAALVIVRYRITQKQEDEEFGQIFIDEAQDFGISPYYAMKKVLPKCYFTIMGDVSQNINYHTGMNDWEDMKKWILTGEKDHFRLLSKSYRNTIEISEYAGRILEKASFGRYRIEPVIRHGIPVREIAVTSEEEMYAKAVSVLEEVRGRGYQSAAVICRDEKQAEWVSKWLTDVTVLPIRLTKGLEFDAVILWNLSISEETQSIERAKMMYVAVTRALHELYILRAQ